MRYLPWAGVREGGEKGQSRSRKGKREERVDRNGSNEFRAHSAPLVRTGAEGLTDHAPPWSVSCFGSQTNQNTRHSNKSNMSNVWGTCAPLVTHLKWDWTYWSVQSNSGARAGERPVGGTNPISFLRVVRPAPALLYPLPHSPPPLLPFVSLSFCDEANQNVQSHFKSATKPGV